MKRVVDATLLLGTAAFLVCSSAAIAKDAEVTVQLWARPEGKAIAREAIKVSASSVLCEGKNKRVCHSAELVLDGEPSTAWCEGKKGQGLGESLTVVFDKEQQLTGFTLVPHYAKSFKTALHNSRARALELQLDARRFTIQLSDMVKMIEKQNSESGYVGDDACGDETCASRDERIRAGERIGVVFAAPIKTRKVVLLLKQVYPGDRYPDACLSELRFFAR